MEIGKVEIDESRVDEWWWLIDSNNFFGIGQRDVMTPLLGEVHEGIEGTRRERVVIYNRIWK